MEQEIKTSATLQFQAPLQLILFLYRAQTGAWQDKTHPVSINIQLNSVFYSIMPQIQ